MIDIHSHIIYDVDDGSKSLSESIKYLKEIKSIGMNKVVCTPHMKYKDSKRLNKIIHNFNKLESEAKKYGIELYLGSEIKYSSNIIDLIKNNDLLTINGSKNILVEFKRHENMDIENVYSIFDKLLDAGYNPILAHPELYYHYRNIEYVKKLKDKGVIIQIDGTSLLMNAPVEVYFYAHKLLKNYLVDIVASDSHCTKKRSFKSLAKAYKKVKRKYGEYADIIFEDNPKSVLK